MRVYSKLGQDVRTAGIILPFDRKDIVIHTCRKNAPDAMREEAKHKDAYRYIVNPETGKFKRLTLETLIGIINIVIVSKNI